MIGGSGGEDREGGDGGSGGAGGIYGGIMKVVCFPAPWTDLLEIAYPNVSSHTVCEALTATPREVIPIVVS